MKRKSSSFLKVIDRLLLGNPLLISTGLVIGFSGYGIARILPHLFQNYVTLELISKLGVLEFSVIGIIVFKVIDIYLIIKADKEIESRFKMISDISIYNKINENELKNLYKLAIQEMLINDKDLKNDELNNKIRDYKYKITQIENTSQKEASHG